MTTKTAPKAGSTRDRLDDIIVVDADVHINEPPGELAPYCEMPWRKSLKALANVPPRYLNIPGYAPSLISAPMEALTARFPGG